MLRRAHPWLLAAAFTAVPVVLWAQGGRRMVRETVLQKDPAAIVLARRMGPTANPELIELVHHADAKVRRIALNCLEETGGPGAAAAMIDALKDGDPQVRGAALSGLWRHSTPADYDALVRVFPLVHDGYAHQQIAMLIGRIPGRPNAVTDLRKLCELDKSPEAQEGCTAALAKLGDGMARTEFVKKLHASRDRDRARYLDYVKYIHEAWLIKPLGPILDDPAKIVRIGVDALPQFPEYLRACDIAVNLIVEIAAARFSFQVNGFTNYTPAQLAEVKQYVQNAPPVF